LRTLLLHAAQCLYKPRGITVTIMSDNMSGSGALIHPIRHLVIFIIPVFLITLK